MIRKNLISPSSTISYLFYFKKNIDWVVNTQLGVRTSKQVAKEQFILVLVFKIFYSNTG